MSPTLPLLAAAVGGAPCRLALFEGSEPVEQVSLPTAGASFAEAARGWLDGRALAAAAIAVAGPVAGGRAVLTNQGQSFDQRALSDALRCPVVLVNDFQAATRGVVTLDEGGHVVLAGPRPELRAPVAALGPGTGLGVGWMVPLPGGDWHVAPTEGGHQDLAPNDPWEAALWAWLRDRHGHVSWERVLSGAGLVALHDFAVHQGLDGVARPTPPRVGSGTEPACIEARDRFAHLLGHFAGNVALALLPRGGVWICGGVVPRIRDAGFDRAVAAAFVAKGRFSELLAGIPLRRVTDPDLGLRGAAAFAAGLPPPS